MKEGRKQRREGRKENLGPCLVLAGTWGNVRGRREKRKGGEGGRKEETRGCESRSSVVGP